MQPMPARREMAIGRTGRLPSRRGLAFGLVAMILVASLGVYSWYMVADQRERAVALGVLSALEVAVAAPTLMAVHHRRRTLQKALPRVRGASYVGVDIGSHSIKVVQVKVDQGRPKVVRCGIVSAPQIDQGSPSGSDAAVASALGNLLKSKRIPSKRIATALSGQNLILRHVQLPKMGEHELREMLKWESEQYIPIPKEESVFDYHVVPSEHGQEQMQVVLVATYRKQVDERVALVKGAGAQLDAIDIEPLVVWRALQAGGYDLGQVVAVVDIGAAGTNLSLFTDGLLQLTRVIPLAGNELTQAVAEGLALGLQDAETRKCQGGLNAPALAPYLIDPVERLTSDVCRSVEFYLYKNRELTFPKVYLVGGSADLPGLRELLARELATTAEKMGYTSPCIVELAHPAKGIVVDECIAEEFRRLDTILAPALGLALREVSP